ncbi:MAG: O-antigen ligase family protein [Legionella sp.]|nr:O-antigen ligase family protein [Legionella sp.]
MINRSEKIHLLSERYSLDRWIPALLALTFFTLPLSSTAKSLSLSLAATAILLAPTYRTQLYTFFCSTWGQATLLFFGLILIASLWSPASFADKSFVFNKYSKLLYLPVLAVGFQSPRSRTLSINAFLIAMMLTTLLGLLTIYGWLPFLPIDPDHIFRNHIITGMMLAFASYLCLLLGYHSEGSKRLGYGFLLLLFTYHVLFINEGRTGYVLYFLMLGICIFQLCSWQKALIGLIAVGCWLLASYTISPVMHDRVQGAVEQFQRYQNDDKNTDIGYRIQFHRFSYQLFQQHPWIGNGTASFIDNARKLNPVPAWPDKLIDPHSQYWLTLVEFGWLGIVILGLFFMRLMQAAWTLKDMKPVAFALIIPFLIGNATDSLLFYSGSGYFFIMFMGLCLGEATQIKQTSNNFPLV